MKKVALLILTLVLAGSMLGCAATPSDAKDTKTVSAYGMSLNVPSEWEDLVDSSSEGFELFGNEATAMTTRQGSLTVSFTQTKVDTYIAFDELAEGSQGDGKVVVINNVDVFRESITNNANTGFVLIPDTGKTVSTAIMILIDKNDYSANKELIESIISSLVVK